MSLWPLILQVMACVAPHWSHVDHHLKPQRIRDIWGKLSRRDHHPKPANFYTESHRRRRPGFYRLRGWIFYRGWA